jgi:acyl carrier protein
MTAPRNDDDAKKLVCWLVASTFNVPLEEISTMTRPEEVDGWDSLGHSVLLTRIVRRLGVPLDEKLAAPIDTVGEMIGRVQVVVESQICG